MNFRTLSKARLFLFGLLMALAPAAYAQEVPPPVPEVNAGAQNIVTAIDGLKPDVTTIVTAGIGLGIIVLGAVIAWKVAKKFFG